MTIHQTVEEVNDGVTGGVLEAISQWSRQTSEALKDLPRLRDLVSRIMGQVKADHPEAKWSFGMHQDGEAWQLTIYSDEPSAWDINDIARTHGLTRTLEGLRLYLFNTGLDEAE